MGPQGPPKGIWAPKPKIPSKPSLYSFGVPKDVLHMIL